MIKTLHLIYFQALVFIKPIKNKIVFFLDFIENLN